MSREIRVGLMFFLALSIFGAALYFLGNVREMVSYKIQFDKVNGLERDSPVQFRGVPIGRVTKIVLNDEVDPSTTVPIIVKISVHHSAREHIRVSTLADLRSVGILGDKTVLLVTPDYSAPVLAEGDFIKVAPNPLDMDKLLEQGEDLVTDFTAITQDLRSILNKMANEKGTLNTLISDQQMADDLKSAVARALNYLEQENNLMGLLLKDPAFAAKVEGRLGQSLDNIAAFSETLKDDDGLVPMLLGDEQYAQAVKAKVDTLLDNSNAYVSSLQEGRGLAYKLTQDEAYAQRVTDNLEKASFHLASILEKIDRGEGSASLLINDPSLYQGLYEVVYGLQHSGLSKWYIQRKQKKGAALNAKDKEQEK